MNITSVLKLATAFVAFSISAHAVEIFSVATNSTTYPVTTADNFNAVDGDGNFTNPYNIYGTTDTANTNNASGSGWGSGVTSNFNGATAWSTTNETTGVTTNYTSVVNPGEQFSSGSGANTITTTYFGPKFYAGLNRDAYKGSAGVIHSNGNGYRIRVNNIVQADIDSNGGNGINFKAVFMFDADTSTLAEGDGFQFSESDTLDARIAVPNNVGTQNRGSLATYRPMVKANDDYYAGPLYTVDLTVLTGSNSANIDISDSAAAATWTLMPEMERTNNSLQGAASHPKNLTVDTSETATTVAGSTLTNITQVGFLLETTGEVNTGGYNFGVKEFTANATAASAPEPEPEPEPAPDLIPWSQDFSSAVTLTEDFAGLSGETHAGVWGVSGNGVLGTSGAASATSIVQDLDNNRVVMSLGGQGSAHQAQLRAVGTGTTLSRLSAPVDHEVTFVFDLISFRNGQADFTVRTRGLDGYVQTVISPAGRFRFSSWWSNYQHGDFGFTGPSGLKMAPTSAPGSLAVAVSDGGTFDPISTDPVVVKFSAPDDGGTDVAEATVTMNAEGTAVASVLATNAGSGYTGPITATFSGGGMTVAPTVTLTYETGNLGNTNHTEVQLGDIFEDGDTLTFVQAYDQATDSLSYYYGLNGDPATTLIATLGPETSPNSYGYYNIVTGNKWVQPRNKDAIYFQYQAWGSDGNPAEIAVNSVAVEFTDKDSDGVINREDAFPDDATETADADGDGVGNNGDVHPGYDDLAFGTYLGTWLTDNNYVVDDGSTGGLTEDDLVDLRAGSTTIDASNGSATITIQMEESSDQSTWTDMGAAGEATVTVPTSGDASFFRVRAQ